MLGVELSIEGAPVVAEAMSRGLLINCTHDYTLRLLPPFIITRAQVREFLTLLESIFSSISKPQSTPQAPVADASSRLARRATR